MSKPETGPEMGCEAKVMPHPSTWSGHGVIRSIEPRSPPGAPIRKLPGALVSVAQKFAETCVQAKRFGFNKLPFATTSAFSFLKLPTKQRFSCQMKYSAYHPAATSPKTIYLRALLGSPFLLNAARNQPKQLTTLETVSVIFCIHFTRP